MLFMKMEAMCVHKACHILDPSCFLNGWISAQILNMEHIYVIFM